MAMKTDGFLLMTYSQRAVCATGPALRGVNLLTVFKKLKKTPTNMPLFVISDDDGNKQFHFKKFQLSNRLH